MTDLPPPEPSEVPRSSCQARLAEIALLFTRLGFTAFGGPQAHVAMMEDEAVRRRRWLDREHFLDLVATLNFIPGPNSTELAIHLGLIRAGLPGLVVAGFCFITPAVLIILPLAWLYVRYAGAGIQPPPAVGGAMQGIEAVVVAILAVAAYRFGGAAFKNRLCLAIALLAVPAEMLLRHVPDLQPEIVILAAAALAGVFPAMWRRLPSRRKDLNLRSLVLPLGLFDFFGGGPAGELAKVGWFFLKVGATLFGSGYVLVSYLQLLVTAGWVTPQQLSDAVAVGQVTPGPLLTTATFIGYLYGHQHLGGDWGGLAGAIVATIAIFLPAFVLVAAFGRILPKIRALPWARSALDAMNAAVAALLVVVTVRFAGNLTVGSQPDVVRIAMALIAMVLIVQWRVNTTWVMLAAGIAGAIRARFVG